MGPARAIRDKPLTAISATNDKNRTIFTLPWTTYLNWRIYYIFDSGNEYGVHLYRSFLS